MSIRDCERKRAGREGANVRELDLPSLKDKNPRKDEQETEVDKSEDGSPQKRTAFNSVVNT